MKRLDGLWVFRMIVRTLIPISLFVVASFPKSYALAGVMAILVIALYVLDYEKLGQNKYIS
jgi:hypothetical protein